MPLLLADVSAHGFGHLAQVGPVLNALAARVPDLRVVIRSGLSREKLVSRISGAFEHIQACSDIAFPMHDAVRVDLEASATAYREAHADWDACVAVEADWQRRLAPDLVFSDVSYLPLAGAAAAGIPSVAMCSLNWADQFSFLFGDAAWAREIHAEIRAAYASASQFLRCTPAMPMEDLRNTVAIPPVAVVGSNRRALLEAQIGREGERLVLVAMGGLGLELPVENWPHTPGLRWLVPGGVRLRRPDITAYDDLGLHFTDLLASVDALVTKPGYGSFVEAAACGTPLLYLRREDWPEQEVLIDWLCRNAVCGEVGVGDFRQGSFVPQLEKLWWGPRRPLSIDGAEVAAAHLAGLLRAGGRNA